MKRIIGIFLLIFITTNISYSFEDCVISTNGKMTNISIENNSILDVYPLITVMNDKNTLIVHPLKVGKTKFSVLKNSSDKIIFNVVVTEQNTQIDDVVGFDIQTLDIPPENLNDEIDAPPILRKGGQ